MGVVRAVRRLRNAARRLVGRRAKDGPPGLTLPEPWVRLLRTLQVDVVVDVGANRGQYALGLRRAGYAGRIVCFEPLSAARERLRRRIPSRDRWELYPYALGEAEGSAVINVAGNLGSSSLLAMLDRHARAAPRSAYVGTETVEVRRFDALAGEVLGDAAWPWLKVDVQGSEISVLRGAGDQLRRFCALQLELSTAPLYAGAPLREEVERFVADAGFILAGVQQGFSHPDTGRMLQFDGLYVRSDLLD